MNAKAIVICCLTAAIVTGANAGSVRIAEDCLWSPASDAAPPLRTGALKSATRSAPLLGATSEAPSSATVDDGQWGTWAIQAAEALKDRLGVEAAADELKVRSVTVDATGNAHVRLAQVYKGLPVRAKELVIHFRPDGSAYQVNGAFVSGIAVDTTPARAQPKDATLVVWVKTGASDGADARLAWRTPGDDCWTYTDANTGAALGCERRRRQTPTKARKSRSALAALAAKAATATSGEEWLMYHIMELAPRARTNDFPAGVACTIRGELPRALWTNDVPCTVEVPGIRGDDGRFYLCGTNGQGRAYAIWNLSGVKYAYESYPNRASPLPGADEADALASYGSDDWGDYHPEAIAAAYNVTTVMDYFEKSFSRATYLGEDATDARTCAFVCMADTDASGRVLGGSENAFFFADVDEDPKSREAEHSGAMYFGYYGDGTKTFHVLDVTAHEFSHSIAGSTAEFVYEGESGALDESFADIFGAGCEAFAQRQGPEYPETEPQTADWFVAEDMGTGFPMRDMADPASGYCDWLQSAAYRDEHWADTTAVYLGDSGGVHTNSGIQNRFFHSLQARIGVAPALQIAYLTVTGYCTPETDFHEVAELWRDAAAQLAGKTANGVAIPKNAAAVVDECWAPLLEKPAFEPVQGRKYVGLIEDLFSPVYVSLGKTANGKTSVSVQIEVDDGWTVSASGSVKEGSDYTSFNSSIGTITLDFAGDNVVGTWNVSRSLLDNSAPSMKCAFTAFHRPPEFSRSCVEEGIPGRFVGQYVEKNLLYGMEFNYGDDIRFSAKGLPAGITIGSSSGRISGTVKTPQSGTAVVTATSRKTGFSATCSLDYEFRALPEWVYGKFAAYATADDTGDVVGDVQVTSAASGAISGRIKVGSKSWSFSTKGFSESNEAETTFTASLSRKSGKDTDTLRLSVTADGIRGSAQIAGVRYSFAGSGTELELALDAEEIAADVYLVPVGVKTEIPVLVASDAPYTVTAKGLPQGLSLRKVGDAYVLTGTAKTPGEVAGGTHLTVKTYALSAGRTFDVRLVVDNYRSDYIPLEDVYDSMGAGVTASLEIPGAAGCTVRGLPAGLKFDAATGTIYGTATRSGDFLVTFTRKVVSGRVTTTETATAVIRVAALPEWVVGTFDGVAFAAEGNDVVGAASVAVTAAGKASGKLVCPDGKTLSFSIPALGIDESGRYTARGTAKSGRTTWDVAVVIDRRDFAASDGGACGQGVASVTATAQDAQVGTAAATAVQNVWASKVAKVPSFAAVKGRKVVLVLADVEGCDITLSIAANGKATITAKQTGTTKTVASASAQVVLSGYKPGEGWTCEIPLILPKAGVMGVYELALDDVY